MMFRRSRPYVAGVVLLAATYWVWSFWDGVEQERDEQAFIKLTEEVGDRLGSRLHDYRMILLSGVALFAASEDVTREEWAMFHLLHDFEESFPGIQALAVVERVEEHEREQHLATVRREGFPSYEIRPPGVRRVHYPVVYVEPHSAENLAALGWDGFAEPVRREAMERARDTGEVAMSGTVQLAIRETGESQPGVLLYAPLYRGGITPATLEQRREALSGFIVGALRMNDLMAASVGAGERGVGFAIFDGSAAPGAEPVYSREFVHPETLESDGVPHFRQEWRGELYGRPVAIIYHSTPEFSGHALHIGPLIGLCAGLLLSLFAFLWLREQALTIVRAHTYAAELTATLKESETMHRTVLDNLPVGVLLVDSDLAVVMANAIARTWFPEHDLDDAPDWETLLGGAGAEPGLEKSAVRAAMASGGMHRTRRSVALGGEERVFGITATPLRVVGGDERGLVVLEDVTEQVRAERERVARMAAEEASRAKSAFVANMSHEIRTPLNAVIGFANVLEKDDSLRPDQAEQVRIIIRSGEHLLGLINDILDMSRIDADRIELREETVHLRALFRDLALVFESRARARGLQCLLEMDHSVPEHVLVDGSKLRQILVNLLGNAVKFTEEGGVALRVRARPATDGAFPPPAEPPNAGQMDRFLLEVEVEDSGVGIPESELEKIFSPFHQVSGRPDTGGTGLGLAITRRLVDLMGGQLQVHSRPGEGTRFHLQLPLDPAQGQDVLARENTPRVVGLKTDGRGLLRALIVDDIEENRLLLTAILQPLGFELREAINGQEAVAAFEEWQPEIVLMDMRMPVMDGYEATRRIKATARGSTTPVVAVTASAFEEDERDVLAAGVDGYIRKPFRPEDLLRTLAELLGLEPVHDVDTVDAYALRGQSAVTPSLGSLERGVRDRLREALADGDMNALREEITAIGSAHPEEAEFMERLAQAYEFDRLDTLLGGEGDDADDTSG